MEQEFKKYRRGSKKSPGSGTKFITGDQIVINKSETNRQPKINSLGIDLSDYRKKFLRLSIIFTVAVIVLIVIYSKATRWIENSSWGIVKRVEVTGLERLEQEEILKAAQVPQDVSLSSLALDSIAARVRKISTIKHARVIKKIPNRVQIVIEERQPVAIFAGKKLVFCDSEGNIFPIPASGEVLDYPIITGDVRKIEDIPTCSALELIVDLHYNYPDLYSQLSEIHQEHGKLEVRLRDTGALVVASDFKQEQSLKKLSQFLEQKGSELPSDIRYVDLTFAGAVYAGTSMPSSYGQTGSGR